MGFDSVYLVEDYTFYGGFRVYLLRVLDGDYAVFDVGDCKDYYYFVFRDYYGDDNVTFVFSLTRVLDFVGRNFLVFYRYEDVRFV